MKQPIDKIILLVEKCLFENHDKCTCAEDIRSEIEKIKKEERFEKNEIVLNINVNGQDYGVSTKIKENDSIALLLDLVIEQFKKEAFCLLLNDLKKHD